MARWWCRPQRTTARLGRPTATLERLKARWKRPQPDGLRVVLMLGEAGVGKTRLASELVDRHRDQRHFALSARAYPLGATASLGLWVEALERRLRSFAEADVLELCGGHVDELAALLPTVSAAAKTPPAGERPRIRLLERARQPFAADERTFDRGRDPRRRPPRRRFIVGSPQLPQPQSGRLPPAHPARRPAGGAGRAPGGGRGGVGTGARRAPDPRPRGPAYPGRRQDSGRGAGRSPGHRRPRRLAGRPGPRAVPSS